MTKPLIVPTVGRRVWFWEGSKLNQTQPYDAGIAFVHSNTMINISYANANGVMHSATSVVLWHGDGERPSGYYCEWMGYQKEQAIKHEAAGEGLNTAAPIAAQADGLGR